MIDAAFGYDAGPAPTNYLLVHDLAGGSILDVGCYPTSMAHLVAGARPPAPSVEAVDVTGAADIGPDGGRSVRRRPRSCSRRERSRGSRARSRRTSRRCPRRAGPRGGSRSRRPGSRVGSAATARIVVERRGTRARVDRHPARRRRLHGRGGCGERRRGQGRAFDGGDAVGGLAREPADPRPVAGGDRAPYAGDDRRRQEGEAWRRSLTWRDGRGLGLDRRAGAVRHGVRVRRDPPPRARGREGARLRAEPDRAEPADEADPDDRAADRRRRELLLLGDREERRVGREGRRVPRRPVQQRRRPEDRARVPATARGRCGWTP